jgi:sortase A
MARVVRGVGWVLVVSGAVLLLYVVYLLWFTGLETERAQRELADAFVDPTLWVPGEEADVDVDEDPTFDVPDDSDEPKALAPGDAYAVLWFQRGDQRIVTDDPLYVVEGVGLDVLRAGPGHYPASDRPGGPGNLAIAGHRTTYGAPFWAVDQLRDGDTIHVVDRDGREWVYAYREQRVVSPYDVWVVDEDPLETGAPTITLTTCHPRGSARQRLIVWGELVGAPLTTQAMADEDADATT